MTKEQFHLHIVSTRRVTFDDTVDEVTVTTEAGEITLLPHHAPLISVLKPGELRVHKDGEVTPLVTAGGILEMRPDNTLVVLTKSIEFAHEIDLSEAEAAYERAKAAMEEEVTLGSDNYARLSAILDAEFSRYNIARKYRR